MKKFLSKFLSGLVIFSFSFFSAASAKGPQKPLMVSNTNLVKNCDFFKEATAENTAKKSFIKDDFYDRDRLNFIYLGKEEDTEPTVNIVKKENPDNKKEPTLAGSNVTKKQNSVKIKSFLTAFNVFWTSFFLKEACEYLKSKYLKKVSNDHAFHVKDTVNSNGGNEKNLSTVGSKITEIKIEKKEEKTKDSIVQEKVNELTANRKDTKNLSANENEEKIEKKETMDSSLDRDVKNEKEENKDSIKDDNISDYKENSGDDLNKNIDNAVSTQDADKLKVDANEDEGLNINENNDSALLYSFIKKVSIFLAIILTFEVIGHLLFWWKTKDATAIFTYGPEDIKEKNSGWMGYKYNKKVIGFWPFRCTENPTEKEIIDYIKSFDNGYVNILFWKPLFGFFGMCKNGKKVNVPALSQISRYNLNFIKGNNSRSGESPAPVIDNK